MTYFNSEYNYNKEVPKAYIFVLWTVNIFDWLLPPLYVYTYAFCFVLSLLDGWVAWVRGYVGLWVTWVKFWHG